MTATPAERFAKAVAELDALKAEGHEIAGLRRMTLGATAAVKEQTKDAAPPIRKGVVFKDDKP